MDTLVNIVEDNGEILVESITEAEAEQMLPRFLNDDIDAYITEA